jgi:hypothetical protein
VGAQGGRQKVAVVPDGYFVLETKDKVFHCFLEADRGTVVGRSSRWQTRDWRRKILAYVEYHRCGAFTKRYGGRGLRVLTVTTGETRLANLRAITEEAGGKARFWFTTFDQVTPATVLTEPIWKVAGREDLHQLVW